MTSQAERRLMTSISLARCRCDNEIFSVNDIDLRSFYSFLSILRVDIDIVLQAYY